MRVQSLGVVKAEHLLKLEFRSPGPQFSVSFLRMRPVAECVVTQVCLAAGLAHSHSLSVLTNFMILQDTLGLHICSKS